MKIFKALPIDPDCEWRFIDGSYIKAHQYSAGVADIAKPVRKDSKSKFIEETFDGALRFSAQGF
jgi:hypothetical protein